VIYTANITTVKNTAQTNLKRTRITVTKGLVYRVEFYFPAGSAGLMGMAVFDGLFQCWPSSVGDFFTGEDQTIQFDDLYLMESAPYEFQVFTYNEDDTYDHFLGVRIGLVSNAAFLARFLPSQSHEYLMKLIAEMSAERDAQARLQKDELEQTIFDFLLQETKRMKRWKRRADDKKLEEKDEGKEFEEVKPPEDTGPAREPPHTPETPKDETPIEPVEPWERSYPGEIDPTGKTYPYFHENDNGDEDNGQRSS